MPPLPLLESKLSRPRVSSDWIPRPALLTKLTQDLEQTLVLVSAPAGYGKTSLLAAWSASTTRKVAWLSLDPGENDISRFMRYLTAAISGQLPADSETGPDWGPFLGWESVEYGLTILINQVQNSNLKLSLVLDNLHVLDNPLVFRALQFLVNHLPPNLSAVFITQLDPLLPLAVLRGKGIMTEIRGPDLCFSLRETETFFSLASSTPPSKEIIKAIYTKTEGWVTGIRLMAAAVNQIPDGEDIARAVSGDIQQISDYLSSEVFEKLNPEVEKFLIQTSILEKLSSPLCNQVVGISNSDQHLSDLGQQNLFLESLDQSGTWYRYHGLLQKTLQSRLMQIYPDLISELHQRASSWFSAAGEFDLAIHHAHQAADDAGAAALLDRHIADLWEKAEFTTIVRWAQRIPPAEISDRTQLSVYLSLALIFTGDLQKGIQRLNHLENQISAESLESARGWLAAGKTYIAYFQRDIPEMIPAAKQALAYLPEHDHTWRGGIAIILSNAYMHLGDFPQASTSLEQAYAAALITGNSFQLLTTRVYQAILNVYQGRLHRALSIIKSVLADEEINKIPTAGVLYAIWADILRERNQLSKAEQKLEKGIQLSSLGGGTAARAWTALVSIKISHSKNNLKAMQKAIQNLEQLSAEQRVPDWVSVLESSWKIRFSLLRENIRAAEHRLAAWKKSPPTASPFLDLEHRITEARVELLRLQQGSQNHSIDALSDQLRELERVTLSSGWLEKHLTVLLIQVKFSVLTGNGEKAFDALQSALSLAESENFVRIFFEEGSQVREIIRAAAARQDGSRYAAVLDQILAKDQPSDLTGPLSEREMEILALIAEGLSNREIGEKLYITTGTVKVHISHIFQKLGVSNRTQAVSWSREFGILS